MVASSAKETPETKSFYKQDVGSELYLQRHSQEMFEAGRSFSGNERDKLFFNRSDGTFADLSDLSGCDSPNDGRAAIACDFDDDGDNDLFVHNLQRERHGLYRNDLDGSYGSFVKVRLRASTSQYEAIGAEVIVTGPKGPLAQVLSRGAGYSSCAAPELIFGLGRRERAQIEVRWPGGELESFGEVAAGARVLLIEGSGEPEPFAARTTRLPDPLPLGLKLAVGEDVPAFIALDPDDAKVTIDVRKLAGGRRVYLNFWASYCAPCVAELPLLERIHDSEESTVVGVSMDAPADSGQAYDLFRKRGASFPCAFLGAVLEEEDEFPGVETLVDLERLPIPMTLVISPEGRLEQVIRGPLREE